MHQLLGRHAQGGWGIPGVAEPVSWSSHVGRGAPHLLWAPWATCLPLNLFSPELQSLWLLPAAGTVEG